MRNGLHRLLPMRRATRRRAARALRWMLCALLVFGLVPGREEVVETLAHLVHDGHLPHSGAHEQVAATEGCDDADEHGCTPLSHHCACCASVSALPPLGALPATLVAHLAGERCRSLPQRGPPSDGVKPALRPPIA